MTNYDFLITLPIEKFTGEIIYLTSSFGGNYQLLFKFLKSTYKNPHPTIRDIFNENFSGAEISFTHSGVVYSAHTIAEFIKKYGTVSESILNNRINTVRTGKNGNVTVII